MGGVLATVPRPRGTRKTAGGHAFLALAGSGFRRYATYRQATLASIATNSVFGFLRCFVLLAALAGAGTGAVRDYDAAQLATYCWVPGTDRCGPAVGLDRPGRSDPDR